MRPLEGQLVASVRFSVTQPRWLEGDERLAEGGTEMNERGKEGGEEYEQPMVINDTHQ